MRILVLLWAGLRNILSIQALIRQIPGAEDSLVFCIWPFYYFKFIGLEKICLFLLREY